MYVASTIITSCRIRPGRDLEASCFEVHILLCIALSNTILKLQQVICGNLLLCYQVLRLHVGLVEIVWSIRCFLAFGKLIHM